MISYSEKVTLLKEVPFHELHWDSGM